MDSKKRAAIYIDGNNFYFAVKKAFHSKIDIQKFCHKLTQEEKLISIKYYTSPVEQISNPKMYAEQQKFFGKLKNIPHLKIILGRLEKRKRGSEIYYVEKASDVNLALDLVLDAERSEYDKAYLLSNDGDFSGAVNAAIDFGREIIYVAIGPKNMISHHLKKVASDTLHINKEFISDCLLQTQK